MKVHWRPEHEAQIKRKNPQQSTFIWDV